MKSFIVFALLAPVALISMAADGKEFFHPLDPARPFEVMVHRGEMHQAPENTKSALARLIEDGFEWAEVDVQLTKDGQHVLFHDSSLDGKSNGTGTVSDHTLEELKKIDLGSWFAERYAGEHILTLAECLSYCKGKLNLYLDCKNVDPELLVSEIVDAGMEDQVVVYDNDLDLIKKTQELSKGAVAVMTKWRAEMGDLGKWVEKVHPDAVEIDADEISPDVVSSFHKLEVKVEVKALGDWDIPEWWDKAFAAGVDYFQTDLPEEIVARATWKAYPQRPTQFSLHRGALRYAPENTFPAFEKALKLGADYIEFDIRPSSDRTYFLLHDRNLGRTTGQSGPIDEHTAKEIESFDAGAWFGKPFVGTPVPKFEDFLNTFSGKVNFYCDAKDIPPEVLAKYLKDHDMITRSAVYQGVDYIAQLNKIDPAIRGMAPLGSIDQIDEILEKIKPYAFDTAWESLSPELIAKAHKNGVKVFSDAMGNDTVEEHMKAISWGIDLIQTNRPMNFIRAVDLLSR